MLDTQQREGLLRLQLAEYEALMNRNTYVMSIQFALWPAALAVLALIIQGSDLMAASHRLLLWSGIIVFEVIGISYVFLISELFRTIQYIEQKLRKDVVAQLQIQNSEARFWQYETHLDEERGASFAGDSWLSFVAVGGVLAVACWCFPFGLVDWIGLGVALLIAGVLIASTRSLRKLRRAVHGEMLKAKTTEPNPPATTPVS